MRLVTYGPGRAGLLSDDGVVDIAAELGVESITVREVLERFDEVVPRLAAPKTPARRAEGLLTPLEPARVIGTGLNYRSHLEEMGVDAPPTPGANFVKLPGAVCGPDDDVVLPAGALVDYEGEIAIVMGAAGVAGLCLANDVSARDVPTTHLVLGKSAPGFCPLGPAIVTLDEVDPTDVSYEVFVNGERRQHAHTSDMIHAIADIVANFSASLPLQAGDVILTGSPSGVGLASTPPRFLEPGDVVTISSPQLGELTNRFVAAS